MTVTRCSSRAGADKDRLLNSMKKFLILIATVSLVFGACERHPANQLPKEGEGVGNQETNKSREMPERQKKLETSPSGTPKRYFPQNS